MTQTYRGEDEITLTKIKKFPAWDRANNKHANRIGKLNSISNGGLSSRTENWDEFVDPGTHEASAKIEFGASWDDAINTLHGDAMNMSLKEMGENSTLGKPLDLKSRTDYAPNGINWFSPPK